MLPERPEEDAEPRPDRRRHGGEGDAGVFSGTTTCSHTRLNFTRVLTAGSPPVDIHPYLSPEEQGKDFEQPQEGRGEMNVRALWESFE